MKVSEARTMIYMPKALLDKCRRRARSQHRSTAFIIRDAVEVYLAKPETSGREEWKKIVRAAAGAWKDLPYDGLEYENRMRRPLKKRHEDLFRHKRPG